MFEFLILSQGGCELLRHLHKVSLEFIYYLINNYLSKDLNELVGGG